jgi:hypothetical protein
VAVDRERLADVPDLVGEGDLEPVVGVARVLATAWKGAFTVA